MKKTLITLGSISVFAAGAYLAFRFSPVGKYALKTYILKKTAALAKNNNAAFNRKKQEAELDKLSYKQLELLARWAREFTKTDPNSPKKRSLIAAKVKQAGVTKTINTNAFPFLFGT